MKPADRSFTLQCDRSLLFHVFFSPVSLPAPRSPSFVLLAPVRISRLQESSEMLRSFISESL